MTTPVIPASEIINLPGVGDRIGAALEPLLAALKEKHERAQRQQQLMTQLGQLKLQEDQFAEEKRQQNEKAKGLKEFGAGLQAQIKDLQNPGPLGQEIAGAMQSGDPQLMEAVFTKIRRATVGKDLQEIRAKYAELARRTGGQLPLEQRAEMFREFAAVDRDNASSWISAANSLTVSARPKQEVWRQADERQPDGTLKRVFYNLTTGKRVTGQGELLTPYTALVREQGTSPQQRQVKAAEQMRLAFDTIWGNGADIPGVVNEEPNIADEVAPFLAKLEVAGNLSIPIVGNTAETALRQYGYQDLSPAAQLYMNAIFNWRAAEIFSKGGAQLTITEIREAARGFMPVVNEDPASIAFKRENMFRQTSAVESLAGPALEKARREREQKRGGSFVPGRVGSDSTRSKLKRTSGIGR